MRISGHTNLDAFEQLPDDVRSQLRGMWIESLEEFIALAAATDESLLRAALPSAAAALQPTRRTALSLLGAPKVEELMRPHAGGALGYNLDQAVVERFAGSGDLRPLRTPPAHAHTAPLPPQVRLMRGLGPPRQQGERGTCVAFSTVALREYVNGGRPELSEQFLYWGCKQIDGLPDAGTYIRTAMTALNLYGTCRQNTWPYNPRSARGNEGQGPPPRGAVDEARRYDMVHSRAVEPTLVSQYRQILAGDRGQRGCPVVFAVLVFASWYMSPETHRTGKITMPLPGERHSDAGHAMCMVGYVDDPDVPGGGYFIARNSWGAGWAAHNPEAPGHALIPYEYIARYGVEAFSGPQAWPRPRSADEPEAADDRQAADEPQVPGSAAADAPEPAPVGPGSLEPFIRRLSEPARDVEGRLLAAATAVLFNPAEPGEFMEDTPANRQRFVRSDHAWSSGARGRAWFPPRGRIEPALESAISKMRAARQQFVAALERNLADMKDQPLPQPGPSRRRLFGPRTKPVTAVKTVQDLTADFSAELSAQAGVPGDVAWPAEWRDLLGDLNSLRVSRLAGGDVAVHVVAAFATPLSFEAPGAPRLDAPGPLLIDLVRRVYQRWLQAKGVERPAFTYFSLGSGVPWSPELEPLAADDHCTVLSHLAEEGWMTRTPPLLASGPALEKFCQCLGPRTRHEHFAAIRACVDRLLDSGYEGNVRVEKISRESGFAPALVEESLEALRGTGAYALYRTDDGELAVKRRGRS